MRALSSIQGKINELNLIMGNQMNNSDTSEFNFNDSKILKESNANFVPEMPMKVAETKNSAKNGRLMINLDHGKENINVLKTPTQKDTRGQECVSRIL